MSRTQTSSAESSAHGDPSVSACGSVHGSMHRRPRHARAIGLFLLGALSALGFSLDAQAATPFSMIGEKVFTVAPDDEAVIKRRPIELHGSVLESWSRAAVDKTRMADAAVDEELGTLRLPLFESAVDLHIESIFKTRYGWALIASASHPEGPSAQGGASRAVLVWGGGHLHGSIQVGLRDRYRVRSTPDGPMIEQVDLSRYPEGPDARPIPSPTGSPRLSAASDSRSGSTSEKDPPLLPLKDSGAEIDLMVAYTPRAIATAGSEEAIRQLIELGVVETNTAFLASRVQTRLRLVEAVRVDYEEGEVEIGTHLDRLTDPEDGFLDDLHPLRDLRHADVVTLVGTGTRGGCGIAWLMEGGDNAAFEAFAFNYVATPCISPNYTFGHEIGHNLGCRHAPDDPSLGEGAFDYSFAYKDPNDEFRTLMAYNCLGGCPRMLRWSNPDVGYDGSPLGTAEQNNARSINEVRELVANFRKARVLNGGRLSWTHAASAVNEPDGSVVLAVTREGQSINEVQVTWEVQSQTAEAGVDMAAASGVLTWGANQDGELLVEIPIFDDNTPEEDESFVVVLRDPSDNAELGSIVTTSITIQDNDVEPFECRTDSERLCLGSTDMGDGSGPRAGDGRFEVTATWRTPGGLEGTANVVDHPAGSTEPWDSGLLWFFSPENWELLVKVLDGCAINDHFWVLFGAGTHLQLELRVTDSLLGRYRTYRNPMGATVSRIDTEAFAVCP